jgi:hypothetical protein
MARTRKGVNQFFRDKILTDPILFPQIGIRLPGLTFGPKRMTASTLTVRDLPKIDIVLLSHAHFDHFDTRTLHGDHGQADTWSASLEPNEKSRFFSMLSQLRIRGTGSIKQASHHEEYDYQIRLKGDS